MKMPAPLLFLTAMICLLCNATADAQRPTVDDFTMSGDTYRTVDDCFRLTDEEDYASGSIWYKRPVSIGSTFAIELKLMLGCKDVDGADGMVFVFTPQTNRTGFRGEGIGFAGLVPSVGIEIDTWENEHLYDPGEDHLAILVNGRVGHFSEYARPIIIPNLEDCARHRFVVRWDPGTQQLSVEIDDEQVVATTIDLVNGVFRGNDVVYWGVTAATGRYNNFHEVCFDRLSMLPLDPTRPSDPVFKGK